MFKTLTKVLENQNKFAETNIGPSYWAWINPTGKIGLVSRDGRKTWAVYQPHDDPTKSQVFNTGKELKEFIDSFPDKGDEVYGNRFADGELIDLDKGDIFVANYRPAGWEDSPCPVIPRVTVEVEGFDDDAGAYGWKITGPKEVADNEEINAGFGFEEFEFIREYKQSGF
jgi:hypothetical protein